MDKISTIPCPNSKCFANMGKVIIKENDAFGITLLLQVKSKNDDPSDAQYTCKVCGKSYTVYLATEPIE